jgi:hypothetical protein
LLRHLKKNAWNRWSARIPQNIPCQIPCGQGSLTDAGEEVLEFAKRMEVSSNQLKTRVFGRDQSVRGLLRATLAPTLATHLLMPDFADFARLHAGIEMKILSLEEPVGRRPSMSPSGPRSHPP